MPAEIARVLRPGANLTVADVTVAEQELPPEILATPPPGPAEWPASDHA